MYYTYLKRVSIASQTKIFIMLLAVFPIFPPAGGSMCNKWKTGHEWIFFDDGDLFLDSG